MAEPCWTGPCGSSMCGSGWGSGRCGGVRPCFRKAGSVGHPWPLYPVRVVRLVKPQVSWLWWWWCLLFIIIPNLTVASVSHRGRKLSLFYPEGTAFSAHRVCSKCCLGTKLATFVQGQGVITRKMGQTWLSVRVTDRGAKLNCRWDPGLCSHWGLKSQIYQKVGSYNWS